MLEWAIAKQYGQFDLNDTFHTVPMTEESTKYTTFEATGRTCGWKIMRFGLKQAPEIWSACLAWIFDSIHLDEELRTEFRPIAKPETWLCVYMEDSLTYADTKEEIIRYNSKILRACENHGFTVNWKKSTPHAEKVLFCGFEFSKEGCQIDPDKHRLLHQYPRPMSAKTGIKWRATLQFNPKHYAKVHGIIEPITRMCKKNVKWEWGTEQEQAWQEWLKIVPQILSKYDPDLQLHLETDASTSSWAAVYYQVDHQGEEQILEFRGGLFNEAERKATTLEREFLTMANAAKNRRYWTLNGKKVIFLVDHQPLLA